MGMDQTRSDFDQLQYHVKIFPELTQIIQAEKIPNALLFSGNENTGRKEAAFFFAKGCNCQEKTGIACNHCKPCRKIEAGSHPDILCVSPLKGKKNISISQIRELASTISSKPNEARFRMVLISPADQMNTAAQNAVLKMLEEPPEKTFFILISARISLLLPTIISRCRTIRFQPLTDRFIEDCLVKDFKVDRQSARMASRTADSDLKKAMIYLNLGNQKKEFDWIGKRQWLLTAIAAMIRSNTGSCIPKGLMVSQKLSADPDQIDGAMDIMKTFFRDLMIFKLHPKKIVNLDFFDTFADISGRIETNMACEWLQNLFETEKKMTSNCSLRLTLDDFFLKLARSKGNLIYG